ncbi:MAG: hypothetical protein U0354_05360 [Candidatus Sericytochromatia bacterium]
MQLIKEFTDINNIVNLLTPENQKILLNEINSIVIKLLDVQKSGSSSIEKPAINTQNANNVNQLQSKQTIQTSQINQEAVNGLNALKNSFTSKGGVNMPPPPPVLSTGPMQMTRSITAGTLNFKTSVSSSKPQNKKESLTLVDSWAYITPELTDIGSDLLNNPSTKSDLYQFLKQVDGKSNLKEIFLTLNPNVAIWAKFLNYIYPLYKERNINLKKQRNFPTDVDIPTKLGSFFVSLGRITEVDLEKALEYQKNPPTNNTNNSGTNNWMDKAKSLMGNESTNSSTNKKKLGEILIEMKFINQEELDNTLIIQKWIKNIIEHG